MRILPISAIGVMLTAFSYATMMVTPEVYRGFSDVDTVAIVVMVEKNVRGQIRVLRSDSSLTAHAVSVLRGSSVPCYAIESDSNDSLTTLVIVSDIIPAHTLWPQAGVLIYAKFTQILYGIKDDDSSYNWHSKQWEPVNMGWPSDFPVINTWWDFVNYKSSPETAYSSSLDSIDAILSRFILEYMTTGGRLSETSDSAQGGR